MNDTTPVTNGQKLALLEEDHGVGEDAYSVACREEVSFRELDELRKRGLLTEDLKLTETGRKESLRIIRAMKDDGTNSQDVENVLTQFQGFLDSTSVLRAPNVPTSFALKLVDSYMQWLSRERHRTARVVSAEQTARFVWLAAAFKKVRDELEVVDRR